MEQGEEVLEREQLARITTENAIRFYGFDGSMVYGYFEGLSSYC
jgi:hypothetical protein